MASPAAPLAEPVEANWAAGHLDRSPRMRQIMNQLRILWTFFRLGAMNELAYRVNFFTQLFQAVMSLVLSLGGLAVVFNQTDTLAGWRPGRRRSA